MTQLQTRYKELAAERDPYLRRGRAFAALTVPSVCPPEGQSSTQLMPESYQSFGARAAKNLASKLLLSMLPPGGSSFTMGVPIAQLVKSGTLSVPPEIAKPLALCEKLANGKIESLAWRRPTFLSLLHLVVVGNVAEYIQPDGRIKLFRLDQFVSVRDWSGKLLEVVTCEPMRKRALPEDLRRFVPEGKTDEELVHLYTRFENLAREGESPRYAVQQDLDGHTVKARQEFVGIMPVNALRWSEVPGENYGRSHVEDNYHDLLALEMHSRNIQEAGAAAARHLIFVRPNAAGGNLRKRVAEARNGAVLAGNPEDVTGFSLQTQGAMQTASAEIDRLQRGLAQSFLMTGDLRRDAERVTAYEIKMLVQELETALGGVYSLLSGEMQHWRITKLVAIMKSRGELPPFPDGQLSITVTTGVEALGRDESINKVRAFLAILAEAAQFQQEASLYIKFDEVLTPAANALGFPSALRTSSEVEQMKAQQQQEQAMAGIAQAAARPVADAMVNQQTPQ